MSLFKEAINLIDTSLIVSSSFYIDIGDISRKMGEKTFGYTCSPGVIACPDFGFDKWIETGVYTYEKTTQEILEKSRIPHLISKLFWTGILATQPLRYNLYEIAKNNGDKMEIIPADWIRKSPKGTFHGCTSYTSLSDHTKYKYLIDCGAGGYSGRVKFLLHTKRPLFLVDRTINKQEFFFKDLKPFIHYIPVKEDLSDLLEKIQWAETHESEANQIAKNAQDFAVNNLNKPAVINFLKDQILTNIFEI